jgi:hypothetical protein
MNMKIENSATHEVRSVIRFVNAKNVRLTEIHRQMLEVHGEGAMNEWNVRKWCRLFRDITPPPVHAHYSNI